MQRIEKIAFPDKLFQRITGIQGDRGLSVGHQLPQMSAQTGDEAPEALVLLALDTAFNVFQETPLGTEGGEEDGVTLCARVDNLTITSGTREGRFNVDLQMRHLGQGRLAVTP